MTISRGRPSRLITSIPLSCASPFASAVIPFGIRSILSVMPASRHFWSNTLISVLSTLSVYR